MNHPQHLLLPKLVAEEGSPKSTTAIFFHCRSKSFDSPIFLDDERLDEVKSSWAHSSRLDRLKKRHSLSATSSASSLSSSSSSRSSSLDNRKTFLKKKKKARQERQQQQLIVNSRWESLPPSPGGAMSQMLNTTPPHHRNGRPTPPKRQKSIENCKDELALESSLRKAKINEASRDQPLTGYHRSGSSSRLNQMSSHAQRSR